MMSRKSLAVLALALGILVYVPGRALAGSSQSAGMLDCHASCGRLIS